MMPRDDGLEALAARLRELLPLPFADDRPDGVAWWLVEPSGHDPTDFEIGERYAAVALATAKQSQEPVLLAMVLRDMVRGGQFSGIEAGFIASIASAAKAGAMN